ncbi:MAG: hypothetical protein IJ060_10810 [Oscillospiraceae bacterium]|nr:hypothetical protein [Oscillospiraceae bacterium]
MEIKEDEIIVGTMYKKKFQWYVSDKTIWRLDYRKYYDSLDLKYKRQGRALYEFVREIGSFGEFCQSRFRIPVVDKSTAGEFFEKILLAATDSAELAYMFMRAESDADRKALLPSLYVDFDGRALYSLLPRDDDVEKFVPDGWRGVKQNFEKLIPLKDRYWIDP